MPLQSADWRFILWFGDGAVVERGVCGVEPHSCIAIEYPMAPALGISKLRFESPPIAAPVDQFRAAVLSRGRNHLQTQSQQPLLLPLRKLFRLHRRAAHQVHGKAKVGIQQARTVYRSGLLGDVTLESSHPVGERGREVCRASKEIQRVVVAEDRYVVSTGGVGHRYCSVEVQASFIESPGDRNCVGMHCRYYIGS